MKRIVKWGVGEELVPSGVMEALRAVDGLKRGRSDARETPPVRPVPDAIVEGRAPDPLAMTTHRFVFKDIERAFNDDADQGRRHDQAADLVYLRRMAQTAG